MMEVFEAEFRDEVATEVKVPSTLSDFGARIGWIDIFGYAKVIKLQMVAELTRR
jgi:hypothetical protein